MELCTRRFLVINMSENNRPPGTTVGDAFERAKKAYDKSPRRKPKSPKRPPPGQETFN